MKSINYNNKSYMKSIQEKKEKTLRIKLARVASILILILSAAAVVAFIIKLMEIL